MKYIRVAVWNPDKDVSCLIHYKHVFDTAKWRACDPGLTEFDCESTELAEIKYQCQQLELTVLVQCRCKRFRRV